MAGISTHVLDTDRGRPVAGVRVDLSVLEDGRWRLVRSAVTDADGRAPMLPGGEARVGRYELAFHVTDYLEGRTGAAEADVFIDDPVVRFAISDAGQHHHVPMLCARASLTTYRGS